MRKFDRVYTPAQYNEVIKHAKTKDPKFEVESLDHTDFIDFKTWWPSLFKKTTKSVGNREDFSISKCKQFTYSNTKLGYVDAYPYNDSLLSQSFKLSKVREVRLPTTPAYVQVQRPSRCWTLERLSITFLRNTEGKVLGWDQSITLMNFVKTLF